VIVQVKRCMDCWHEDSGSLSKAKNLFKRVFIQHQDISVPPEVLSALDLASKRLLDVLRIFLETVLQFSNLYVNQVPIDIRRQQTESLVAHRIIPAPPRISASAPPVFEITLAESVEPADRAELAQPAQLKQQESKGAMLAAELMRTSLASLAQVMEDLAQFTASPPQPIAKCPIEAAGLAPPPNKQMSHMVLSSSDILAGYGSPAIPAIPSTESSGPAVPPKDESVYPPHLVIPKGPSPEDQSQKLMQLQRLQEIKQQLMQQEEAERIAKQRFEQDQIAQFAQRQLALQQAAQQAVLQATIPANNNPIALVHTRMEWEPNLGHGLALSPTSAFGFLSTAGRDGKTAWKCSIAELDADKGELLIWNVIKRAVSSAAGQVFWENRKDGKTPASHHSLKNATMARATNVMPLGEVLGVNCFRISTMAGVDLVLDFAADSASAKDWATMFIMTIDKVSPPGPGRKAQIVQAEELTLPALPTAKPIPQSKSQPMLSSQPPPMPPMPQMMPMMMPQPMMMAQPVMMPQMMMYPPYQQYQQPYQQQYQQGQ
jgi:hypothetical protein